jgi:hypothetical protein
MTEQIDIAEALGAVSPALPDIQFPRAFQATQRVAPPMLFEGMLHQG